MVARSHRKRRAGQTPAASPAQMNTSPLIAAASGLAWALARRAPSRRRRDIAAALTGLLCVNVGRAHLDAWPTLDLAAFVAWYALTASAAWSVLRKDETPASRRLGGLCCAPTSRCPLVSERPLGWGPASRIQEVSAGPAILLALTCLASSVFAVRLGLTAELARAAFALALAAQLLAVLRFAARGTKPDDAQGVALILAASSAADIAGPWLCGHASRDWYAGTWPAVITWIAVAAWEIRCLIRRR